MTSHTPSAAALRGRVILGDSVVKAEIEAINAKLEVAADNGKTRLVIRDETTMTKSYNYGNWFLIEEFFQYGALLKQGDFTSVQALGGPAAIEGLSQPEVLEKIKSKDSEIFPKHARINAVLAHYRKLGYQMHPGNWFDATQTNNVIWVLNWNNTLMDHITVVDNTLVIGKTTQRGALGATDRDGTVDAAGNINPIGGYYKPAIPQTRIEFYGLGNKGTGQVDVTPADGKMGTNNVNYHVAAQSVTEGLSSGEEGAALAAGAAAGVHAMALVADLAGAIGSALGDLTKIGLYSSEVGQGGAISATYGNGAGGGGDFAEVPGFINTGDGVVPDEINTEILNPIGQHVVEGTEQIYDTGLGTPGGGGGGGGLVDLIGNIEAPSSGGGGGSGGGSGSVVFTFKQTSMPCSGCGWLFSSSQLSVTGNNGSANIPGPGFLAKVGRGTATIRFSVPSSVGSVSKATLYLRFDTAEGIANADYSSVVVMGAGGKTWKVLKASAVKAAGYSKARPNFPVDVTGYVKSVVGSAGGSLAGGITTNSFLWKPISEKRDIAILIGAVGGTLTANGIQASYSGQTNGNRATFRIPWSSGLLNARNITVKHSYGGSWTVPVGNQRYTA